MSSDIAALLEKGEAPTVRFIKSLGDFDAIAASVCAFLNTSGGTVFVGVGQDADSLSADRADDERRELEVRLQEAILPKALFTISVDHVGDVTFLSIDTPVGRDRPYSFNRKSFVRKGLEIDEAGSEWISEVVATRAFTSERWERRPSTGLSDDELNSQQLDRVTSTATRLGRLQFESGVGPIDVVRRLGLITSGALTNGCDVLFAMNPERRHPQARVRFVQYGSDKAGSTYLDDQWISGPLGSIFERLIERLSSVVRIQARFQPDDHTRSERANYSLEVLREGLINALAHRDYASFSGGVTVHAFPDRIEIWNSGELPRQLKVTDLRSDHPSIPTNPDITYVLYLHGFMERLGRGTQKIISACKELGARPPKWESRPSGVTLTIYASTEGTQQALRLNPRQRRLIENMPHGGSINVVDYLDMQSARISERQGRRDLAELTASGLLERVGQARALSYRRTELTL